MSAERIWVHRAAEVDQGRVALLERELGLSRTLALLLAGRGFDLTRATALLNHGLRELPDPFLLKGMATAVERLQQALNRSELIAIHGDYDVDGISATALLVRLLQQLGGRVEYHIPLRMEDGYGLSANALRDAAAAGATVVVSVDCGVTAVAEAEVARQLGLDLIITDHHQPHQQLPDVLSIINPHQADCSFPDKGLSGVGVAFFVAVGLRKQLREHGWFESRPEPDLRELLDLVTLGTIADLVCLEGVNRVLVRAGLVKLEMGEKPGVAALKQVADVRQVNSGAVGFRLAPRLNAAGRLEDARRAVELLLTADAALAAEIAAELNQYNQQRQQLEKQIFAEAVAMVEESGGVDGRYSLVLGSESWHQGVIGIVASRLVERFHRPTVLIALDGETGKGSGRSISGFHLFLGLERCSGELLAFGGHEYAAGLSLSQAQLPAFVAALEAEAKRQLQPEALIRKLSYDLELLLEEIPTDFVDELELLAPYGSGHPEPVFLASGVTARQLQIVGEDHLRFICCQGGFSFPAIAFGMAAEIELFQSPFDLLFTPTVNEWRNRKSLQLRVRDARPVPLAGRP